MAHIRTKLINKFRKLKKNYFFKDEDIMTFDKIKLYFTSITAKKSLDLLNIKVPTSAIITRHRQINIEIPKSEFFRQSLQYVISKIETVIPDEIMKIQNINAFKTHLKSWIINSAGSMTSYINLYR